MLILIAVVATVGAAAILVLRTTGLQAGLLSIGLVALTPYAVPFAGVGVIAAGIARAWIGLLVPAIVFLLIFATQLPLFVPRSGGAAAAGAARLTVLTANVEGDAANIPQLVETITHVDPDVLMLEALSPYAIDTLARAGLKDRLPYRAVELGTSLSGTGIWSRYPLHDTQVLSGFIWPQVTAKVDTPQLGPVTVVAVHTISPRPGLVNRWTTEHERLNSALGALPGLVIAAGDFNATFDHEPMRQLRGQGYADAADDAGAGVVRTWPATRLPFPVIGIDHVMIRGQAVAEDVKTLPPNGSDHLPLAVVIRPVDRPA